MFNKHELNLSQKIASEIVSPTISWGENGEKSHQFQVAESESIG